MKTLLCLLVSLQPLWTFGQESNSKSCLVMLQVSDYHGVPQKYELLWIKNEVGIDYGDRFDGLRGYLPCGYQDYRFEVSRTDIDHVLGRIQGTITVERPETWKTIMINPNVRLFGKGAGELSMALPANYVWRGRLGGKKNDEQLWIHIRSAVGSSHAEAAVDMNGDFRVYRGFTPGKYLFYVMNAKGEVVKQTVLDITRFGATMPLLIDLGKDVPVPIIVE